LNTGDYFLHMIICI